MIVAIKKHLIDNFLLSKMTVKVELRTYMYNNKLLSAVVHHVCGRINDIPKMGEEDEGEEEGDTTRKPEFRK